MWLAYTEGSVINPEQARNGAAKLLAQNRTADIIIGSHIDMKAADGILEIGWRPTTRDMLAEDWEVVQ